MADRQKVRAAIEKLKQLGSTYNEKDQNITER